GRIERHACLELRRGARLVAAVPQRDAEMVVRVRRVGAERDRALEVTDGRGKVSLLSKRKAEQRVRVRVFVVDAKRGLELLARAAEIAPPESLLRAAVEIVRSARRRGRPPSGRGAALLLQHGAQRVVALAHFRIDLEGSLVGGDGAGGIAAL